jgi:pyruvate dehydrogenase E2 component (dihydrolipoamide acetyltransferase)
MSISIMMPNIGAGTNQGKIIQWLKAPGDNIKVGEIIAEIETDKAIVELEALDGGTLETILVAAGGDDVVVGSVIATLLGTAENRGAKQPHTSSVVSVKAAPPADQTILKVDSGGQVRSSTQNLPAHRPTESLASVTPHRFFASPSARRTARELRVDISTVTGSGPNGRIVRVDIERSAQGGVAPAGKALEGGVSKQASLTKPHTAMRRAIARRLVESKQSIPHFYLKATCDVTALTEARQTLNARLAAAGNGEKISLNDLIVLGVSRALSNVPEMNVRWNADWIEQLDTVDISVAVSVDAGLITPIVQNANLKGLREISSEIRSLAETAKKGKLQPAQYTGGSFTISNLGMYGIDEFVGIINPPQCAILAVGRVKDQVTLSGTSVQSRPSMTMTLSADHRLIDGALGARFLQELKQLIESPTTMLL